MELELEAICGYKIQAHRRALLPQDLYECRFECNGHKVECPNYTEVKVPTTHYLCLNN